MVLQLDPTTVGSLGADLRALRKARGLTLQAMADALGRSVGWISQVERDLSEPSIKDLQQFAAMLDVGMSTLFQSGTTRVGEDCYVVRKDTRRPIGSRTDGLIEELLSPDLTDDFEVVHSTFAPGSAIADPVMRPTQEVGYLVSGQLDLEIDSHRFTISAGDSFRVRGEPFRWSNPYDVSAVAIWVIAPPVY